MGDTFARTGNLASGYDPQQVDDFLARAKAAYSADPGEPEGDAIDEHSVRNVAFDWVRDGYDPAVVDSALDRLESAFIQRRRAFVMADAGEKHWLEQTYSVATTLYPRMRRPLRERFRDADGDGYKKEEVDALVDRIAKYFDGSESLTSTEIRNATFSRARNEGAYWDAVVDVYLDRAVSVLLSVE